MKSYKDDEFFLGVFQNEHIAVVMEYTTKESTEDSITESQMTFYGFLLGVDDQFMYLGETTQEVTKAVSRDKVLAIIDTAKASEMQPIGVIGH